MGHTTFNHGETRYKNLQLIKNFILLYSCYSY